jgi:glycosyltransferase involved in cell wall biosynthesis
MKTKVLFVVESFATGVYAVVHDIACNLNPDKFEIKIIHSIRSDTPQNYANDFKQQNIELIHVQMDSIDMYFKAIRNIKSIINEFCPDLIHLHSSKAGFLGRIAAKHSKTKVYYSPHGFSFIRTDVSSLTKNLFLYLERYANRKKHSTIIAVSQSEAAHARRITDEVVVINNFIDTQSIQELEESEDPFVVTCGRITAARNPKTFNQIAQQLPDIRFVWIGDGEDKYELTSENINITGYLPRKEVFKILPKAAVYIQPSLWEGMPVAVLEAMAAAKPVVASNIIGNKDLIEDGKTGMLFNPEDIDGFVQTITTLLDDKNLRTTIGKNAREYVAAHHDVKVALQAYESLYTSNRRSE